MKRLVASMLAIAVAICFSFSTGCTPTKKEEKTTTTTTAGDKEKKFSADPAAVTLDKKDAESVIAFKHGKPSKVENESKDISAKLDGEKVTVKQLIDAPDAEKKVEFTVTGEKDATTKVTVTIAKKK